MGETEGNVWHVELLDTKGDGRKQILHSNVKGQLLIRDSGGEVIAHYLPNYYVSDFTLTRWGTESASTHILVLTEESGANGCKGVFLVLDAQGRTVARFKASLGDLLDKAKGTPVRDQRNVEYYAVLESKSSLKRSMLCLYDPEGQIAYQEIVGDYCHSVMALPGERGDKLLVGCSGMVWQYSMKGDSARATKRSTQN